jgi:hypothetical protein
MNAWAAALATPTPVAIWKLNRQQQSETPAGGIKGKRLGPMHAERRFGLDQSCVIGVLCREWSVLADVYSVIGVVEERAGGR